MEVLELLRKKQAASAETISAELGITANAVRQHLTNLVREGFVRSEPVRRKRGRPSLLFSLTARADAVFPKRYGQLATMVLTEIQDMQGPEALDEIFRRVALRHAGAIAAEIDEEDDFDAKLERLVSWIGRAATLATTEETEDGVQVTIHNCPFRNTALKYPQVCTITPRLLVKLLDVQVSQEASIHRRDPYCAFLVQRPAGGRAAAREPAEPQ